MEIIRPYPPARPRVALFDFDGTLSLIRSGWQQLMHTMMLELLLPLFGPGARALVERRAADTIERLTGRPTIEQMAWLSAEVERGGGRPQRAEVYKTEFHDLLGAHIRERSEALRAGTLPPDALLVPGARALLAALRDHGVQLVLASGTDQADVVREAADLQIAGFFGQQIYGPGPHDPGFSKRAVIERLRATDLVAFGDGPVEIAETRAAGGYAVGVAFDELAHAGVDPRKRAMLISSGADLIVADFGEHAGLTDYLRLSAGAGRQ